MLLAVCSLLVIPVSAAAPSGGSPSAFDSRLSRGECALLGRAYDRRLGCARTKCIAPAVPFKRSLGKEMCALPGQGRYGFGSAVDYRRCASLHRRWVSEVDWCASNPDRRVGVIVDAPQCVGDASTYVTHRETEGWYDECLRPQRVAQLRRIAKRHGTSLSEEAALRSRTLCRYRPGHEFARGLCRRRVTAPVAVGGTLLVGDSLTWRGTNELGELWPGIRIDGLPARQLGDLAGRLNRFRLDHGDPTNLIVELGTNRGRTYSERDLQQDIAGLPPTTLVMLVLPYRGNRATPSQVAPFSTRHASWMVALADTRPLTCIADWRALVKRHPAVLGDGVHAAPAMEWFWAKWMKRSWDRCQSRAARQRADS